MQYSWQEVLDKFPYGIYLVTIKADGLYNGMIASWVTQCSHEPPLIALAIRKNRLSHSQLLQSGEFGISVLPQEAAHIVKQFKIPQWQRKFEGLDYDFSDRGNPVLKIAIGYLDCVVEKSIDAGDHSLFIAKIAAGKLLNVGQAFSTVEYEGKYRGNA